MKKPKQQEVLLLMDSSFAQRQWYKREDTMYVNPTPEKKLEEACANGLVQQLLPEVFTTNESQKMYLWQMHLGFSFLQLELGELPLSIQKEFSLDPHNFLRTACLN